MTFSLTRRAALTGAAALPFAGAAAPVLAASGGGAAEVPVARSFMLGEMPVTTLLDGTAMREGPKDIFAGNVSDETFEEVSRENFISPDAAQFYFTPTLVETGGERVLFDTGLGKGGLQRALAAARHRAGGYRRGGAHPYASRPHRRPDEGWRPGLCQCPLCDGGNRV